MLHVSELHSGVDWAAPFGTPIFAAGNGDDRGNRAQGRLRQICPHPSPNGYETAYGHMTAFARGLDVGSKVRQGQVIGFVGSTGMSTGSHVHFEILINDRFVDPMRIKLPRGRVLDGATLAAFDKDRDQLDAVLSHAPSCRRMSRRRISNVAARASGAEPRTVSRSSSRRRVSSRLWALFHFNLTRWLFPARMIADHIGVSTNIVRFWLTPWRRTDEHLPLSHIAEVTHIRGFFWDAISVESSGGLNPLRVERPAERAGALFRRARARADQRGGRPPHAASRRGANPHPFHGGG